MEETAERILEILQDYHCDFPATKYEMSVEHITKWANQFEDDAAFVLSELLHFLPQIYISKSKAIELLKQRLIDFQNLYKYQTMNEFIMNTHFIDVQKEEKSQKQILTLVKEIINNGFGINYDLTINEPKKHHIYFDDVLATGGTIKAVCELVERLGGEIVQCNFIMELSFLNGREKIKEQEIFAAISY